MATTSFYTVNGSILGERTGTSPRIVYGSDALGSVVRTIQNASVVNTYRYKPYGATLSSSGSGSTPQFQWVGTQGYRSTALTGAEFYVRMRHYSSTTASWTTVDPIWPATQAYVYAASNPTTMVDPSGLDCKSEPLTRTTLIKVLTGLYGRVNESYVNRAFEECALQAAGLSKNTGNYPSPWRDRVTRGRYKGTVPDSVTIILYMQWRPYESDIIRDSSFVEVKAYRAYSTLGLYSSNAQPGGMLDYLSGASPIVTFAHGGVPVLYYMTTALVTVGTGLLDALVNPWGAFGAGVRKKVAVFQNTPTILLCAPCGGDGGYTYTNQVHFDKVHQLNVTGTSSWQHYNHLEGNCYL
jgi:RHS repeat-associated protein